MIIYFNIEIKNVYIFANFLIEKLQLLFLFNNKDNKVKKWNISYKSIKDNIWINGIFCVAIRVKL